MRKFIIIAVLMYSFKLCANPIVLPPVISEFYYNGGDWQIEVYFDEIYQALFTDFSGLTLISNTDTAYFVAGLNVEWNSTMVINQNAMSSAFFIDPTADWIYITTLDFFPLAEGIRYGSAGTAPHHYTVTTPKAGESIVNQYFEYGGGDGFFLPMKESSPTIGSDPFECSSRGSFSGYVFDQNSNPVEGVKLAYCQEVYCSGYIVPAYSCIETDENGYFETVGLFCNWHFFFLRKDNYVFMIDTLFIEPDSLYYKEYNLTSVSIAHVAEEQEISVKLAPNPFSHKTTFYISTAEGEIWNDANIFIRDMNGRILDQIQVSTSPWVGSNLQVEWLPGNAPVPIPPGLYIYSLEVDGKHIISNKMIISN